MAEHLLEQVTADQFGAMAALRSAVNLADGRPMVSTEDEIAGEWTLPYVDLARDVRAVRMDGRAVGNVFTYFLDSEEKELRCYVFGGVHPDYRGRGIGRELMEWGVSHARTLLARNPSALPKYVRAEALSEGDSTWRLCRRFGMEPVRWFADLHRETSPPLSLPAPHGFRVVRWDSSRSAELLAVKNAAFRDHWGSTPTSTEGWEQMTSGWGSSPETSFMALDDGGNIIGLLLSHRYESDDEVVGNPYGWIDKLATLRDWRGRGVASHLIMHALAAYDSRGWTHAALGVDTDNPTGAHGLYTSLGFTHWRGQVNLQIAV
ncbi:MAG: GNAT family N-acetyltransferase [Ilumatobacteraceae bacterium]